jgi:hypothetical protein
MWWLNFTNEHLEITKIHDTLIHVLPPYCYHSIKTVLCSELSSGLYCRVKRFSTDVKPPSTRTTSVDKQFKRQYNQEDNSEHHTRRRENLKSHKTVLSKHLHVCKQYGMDFKVSNAWCITVYGGHCKKNTLMFCRCGVLLSPSKRKFLTLRWMGTLKQEQFIRSELLILYALVFYSKVMNNCLNTRRNVPYKLLGEISKFYSFLYPLNPNKFK